MRSPAIILVTAIAGLAACALVSRQPPENVCDGDEDCFRAQGEICNVDTHRCEPGPDAGIEIDAAVDATTTLIDAPEPDAP